MAYRSSRTSVSKLSSEQRRAALPAVVGLVFGLGGLLGGCDTETLTPPSEVVRDRVAAIRAEPAEIPVGGSTTLEALLVHPGPDAPDLGQLWFACLESGGAQGCLGTDFGAFGDAEPGELQFGLGETFVYTAQGPDVEAAWEALEPADRVEGLSVFISVAFVERNNDELLALFAALGAAAQSGDQDALDEASSELEGVMDTAIMAARRIIISDKATAQPDSIACSVDELLPNSNPSLDRLVLHLDPEGRDSGFEIDDEITGEPEQTLVLRPQLSEGSVEDYLYITTDGETECRTEALFFAWLSNGGTHGGDYSFVADAEDQEETPGRPKVHSFTLPPEEEFTAPIDLWLVVRDRRGGIGWRQWNFSPAP